jgi:hypothetical protein
MLYDPNQKLLNTNLNPQKCNICKPESCGYSTRIVFLRAPGPGATGVETDLPCPRPNPEEQ